MTSTVPTFSDSRVMPRRSSVFGVPPSTIHSFFVPSGSVTSMWIHACGFTHSTFVTGPFRRTGLFGSNSPPKAWCPRTGAIAASTPATDNRIRVFIVRTSLFLAFLRVVRFLQARAAQNVAHRIVPFVARVLVELLVRDGPGVLSRPRPRPRVGVFNGKPVQQVFGVHSREPLDDVEAGG